MADVVALFEEYAAAYSRGDRPRAQDYLERAGPAADELAKLIDGWLRAVPVPEPDEETTARDAAARLTAPSVRLAVLPFVDLSQEDRDGYFAEGQVPQDGLRCS